MDTDFFSQTCQRLEGWVGGMSRIHIYPLYIPAGNPHVCLSVKIGELRDNRKSAKYCLGCQVCNTFAATYRASMHAATLSLTVSSPVSYRATGRQTGTRHEQRPLTTHLNTRPDRTWCVTNGRPTPQYRKPSPTESAAERAADVCAPNIWRRLGECIQYAARRVPACNASADCSRAV